MTGDPIEVGGNPFAVAIDGNRVFVTLFYARLINGGPGEGFDVGKEAVVQTFTLAARDVLVGIRALSRSAKAAT